MAIGNGSGREVEYDVEPSDPGGGGGGNLVDPLKTSLLLTSLGTAFVGVGCLTRMGGLGLELAGLGLLAAGLVFQGIALDRARRLATIGPLAVRNLILDRRLTDGEEHPHVFAAGTWVNYRDPETKAKLASSPKIFNPNARVTLRRNASGTTNQGDAPLAEGGYWVEVT